MARKTTPGAGEMTVRQAGRKGGNTTKERYADEGFYQKVGSMGGAATAERHGHPFYERIGKLGGARVRELVAQGKAAEGKR